jgi:DNA-binding HxlR family transcriptional regulator
VIQAGRPRKPSYTTMRKIIATITICSCGKAKNRKRLTRAIIECECVGPKSWSQLLKLTRLHRNTLSRACKFLVKKRVLTRTVLKKKGHHVTYSVNDSYQKNMALSAEIELTVKDREKLVRKSGKTYRSLQLFAKQYEKMRRYYAKRMKLMREQWPEAEKLPAGQYLDLVRLVDILGEEEGLKRFLKEYP